MCSSLLASLSSQPARCTYNLQPDLLGSFLADYWPVWVWPKGEIYTFSGGGEKAIRYSVYIDLISIKETWDHFT